MADLVGEGACLLTDHRAVERPQGEACDSGAFELVQQPTSPDTTPPRVKSTVPKADSTRAAPHAANVKATFDPTGSEDMIVSSTTGQTFKLQKKGSTTKIAATVSYNADTNTAKLDPTNFQRGE